MWQGSGRELADLVMSPRDKPLVIVSRVPGSGELHLDTARIEEEVGDWADVVLVRNGTPTRELQRHLPENWQVFGNAARVYPRPVDGLAPGPGRYFMARDPREVERRTRELIDEVLALPGPAAAEAGPAQPVAPARVEKAGTVKGFFAEGACAWVELDDGGMAQIAQPDVVPGVRLDWLLSPKQEVQGLFDAERHTLDIAGSVLRPRLLEAYTWGQVVLCLVLTASVDRAVLSPLPGEEIEVLRADVSSNELDGVDSLLAPGQVVAARLVLEAGRRRLRLVDVDDDDPVAPAPVLVRGGLPWLVEGRDLLPPAGEESDAGEEAAVRAPEAAAVPAQGKGTPPAGAAMTGAPVPPPAPAQAADASGGPALPGPAGGPLPPDAAAAGNPASDAKARGGAALTEALLKVAELKARVERAEAAAVVLQDAAARAGQAEAELARERAEAARLRMENLRISEQRNKAQKLARKGAKSAEARPARELFSTGEEALRHEVYLAWVERIPALEKADRPLRQYGVGAGFAKAYFAQPPDIRHKAAKALVDLLTAEPGQAVPRQVHEWRTGRGGHNPPHTRDDGAVGFRMYVEENTPGARRLHFWKLPDGGIELHDVGVHDKDLA
ncbi:hypothetical protein NCCP1664_21120 [Zafaria cholistanensis]|uniref:S1 motif domain-containing protein n=2 Tax=Zafaria cholistanensis TaxID=1682741 RepID=A0A5A7NUQ0_9MICC|nr:hypothetical protein NCCP1664_21120 [Zafaria cholistanensis]